MLAPGFHADLAIVDRDPIECPLDELPRTQVRSTLLGGRVVHDDGLMDGAQEAGARA